MKSVVLPPRDIAEIGFTSKSTTVAFVALSLNSFSRKLDTDTRERITSEVEKFVLQNIETKDAGF